MRAKKAIVKRATINYHEEDKALLNSVMDYKAKSGKGDSDVIKELMQIALLALDAGYVLENKPKLVRK